VLPGLIQRPRIHRRHMRPLPLGGAEQQPPSRPALVGAQLHNRLIGGYPRGKRTQPPAHRPLPQPRLPPPARPPPRPSPRINHRAHSPSSSCGHGSPSNRPVYMRDATTRALGYSAFSQLITCSAAICSASSTTCFAAPPGRSDSKIHVSHGASSTVDTL